MNTALGILGLLAAVLVLLSRVRLGVLVTLKGRSAAAEVRAGPLRFRVYPPKGGARQGASSQTERTASGGAKASGKRARRPAMAKLTLRDLKEGAAALGPPLKRALIRAGRGIRVSPLEISVTLGGTEDPAQTAELYGLLHAVLWTGMPVLENLADIRDPKIRLGIDFDRSRTEAEGRIGVSARLGTLLAAALEVGVPALRWLIARQRRTSERSAVSTAP